MRTTLQRCPRISEPDRLLGRACRIDGGPGVHHRKPVQLVPVANKDVKSASLGRHLLGCACLAQVPVERCQAVGGQDLPAGQRASAPRAGKGCRFYRHDAPVADIRECRVSRDKAPRVVEGPGRLEALHGALVRRLLDFLRLVFPQASQGILYALDLLVPSKAQPAQVPKVRFGVRLARFFPRCSCWCSGKKRRAS